MFTAGRFERIKAPRSVNRPDLSDVCTAGVGASGWILLDRGRSRLSGDHRRGSGNCLRERPRGGRIRQIKIIYDDLSVGGMSVPMIDRQALAALIAAAHARRKKPMVHVTGRIQRISKSGIEVKRANTAR